MSQFDFFFSFFFANISVRNKIQSFQVAKTIESIFARKIIIFINKIFIYNNFRIVQEKDT